MSRCKQVTISKKCKAERNPDANQVRMAKGVMGTVIRGGTASKWTGPKEASVSAARHGLINAEAVPSMTFVMYTKRWSWFPSRTNRIASDDSAVMIEANDKKMRLST
jgi:hypothetical protein